jgi:hypothetical protein
MIHKGFGLTETAKLVDANDTAAGKAVSNVTRQPISHEQT